MSAMPNFPVGLPLTAIGQGSNLYIWSIEGDLVGEYHEAFEHEELVGLKVHDLFLLHPEMEENWESALNGISSSWIVVDQEVKSLGAFIPHFDEWCPNKVNFILGVGSRISELGMEWFRETQKGACSR